MSVIALNPRLRQPMLRRAGALLLVGVFALAACSGDSPPESVAPPPQTDAVDNTAASPSVTPPAAEEPPLAVSGNGLDIVPDDGPPGAANLALFGNGIRIAADEPPRLAAHTDFGAAGLQQTPVVRSFTVRNDGDYPVQLDGVILPDGFTLLVPVEPRLQPGASVSFLVRLDTAIVGEKSGDLRLKDRSGAILATIAIRGLVAEPTPRLVVFAGGVGIAAGDETPDRIDQTDFGAVGQGVAPPARVFTIRNGGEMLLGVREVRVPSGFILLTQPQEILIPGGATTFQVRLDTSVQGVFAGQIEIDSNDPAHNLFAFAIQGVVREPVPPRIEVRGNGLDIATDDTTPDLADLTDFGEIWLGSPLVRAFEIFNGGDTPLAITGIDVPPGFTVVAPAPTSVGPGAQVALRIRAEAGTLGLQAGVVRVHNSDRPFAFDVRVLVITPPSPAIAVVGEGAAIGGDGNNVPQAANGTDFGIISQGPNLAEFTTHTFTIRNLGASVLTVTSVSVPEGFRILRNAARTVAPGATTYFEVQMDTDVAGSKEGEIRIVSNGTPDPYVFRIHGIVSDPLEARINVFGDGRNIVNRGSEISTDTLTDFGRVFLGAAPVVHTFTIRNTGGKPVTLGAVSVPEGFSLVKAPAQSLAPGESTTFQVRLDAQTAGPFRGELLFAHDALNANPFYFAIEGIVSPPGAILTMPSPVAGGGTAFGPPPDEYRLDFGTAIQHQNPSQRELTIGNGGVAPLQISAVDLPPGFSVVGSTPRTILPGATATLRLALQAGVVGNFGGIVAIHSNDVDRPTATLRVSGAVRQPPPPAPVIVVPGTSSTNPANTTGDFGTVAQGSPPVTRTFTIRNDGTLVLRLGAITASSGFTLLGTPAAELAPGESTQFQIRMDTLAQGHKSGSVTIESNDVSRNPLQFAVRGSVLASPGFPATQ